MTDHIECGYPWDEHICPDVYDTAVEDATASITRHRRDPMPLPPQCDHTDRPKGKPLCATCWHFYKPEYEAWAERSREKRSSDEKP